MDSSRTDSFDSSRTDSFDSSRTDSFQLGARIEDTIAFGDAKVDIPMFECCAFSVCMGSCDWMFKKVVQF